MLPKMPAITGVVTQVRALITDSRSFLHRHRTEVITIQGVSGRSGNLQVWDLLHLSPPLWKVWQRERLLTFTQRLDFSQLGKRG